MSKGFYSANAGIRFLLEICLLMVAAYWGFHTDAAMPMRISMSAGITILVVGIWGLWLAPKSAQRLQEPMRSVLELSLFAVAVWGLFQTGHFYLAVVFGAIYTLNKAAMIAGER
ncbi:MAG: YrdB family protein [Caldilineaceae bacterium]